VIEACASSLNDFRSPPISFDLAISAISPTLQRAIKVDSGHFSQKSGHYLETITANRKKDGHFSPIKWPLPINASAQRKKRWPLSAYLVATVRIKRGPAKKQWPLFA
jgi:hypothetical protein